MVRSERVQPHEKDGAVGPDGTAEGAGRDACSTNTEIQKAVRGHSLVSRRRYQ